MQKKRDDAIPTGFEPRPKTVKRPLVGDIACGEPITAEQNVQEYVDVPEGIVCDFCLRCHGDSMIDASGIMMWSTSKPSRRWRTAK